MRKAKRVSFTGSLGHQLAGILDLPAEAPRAFGLFSHCFTCNKDLKVIARLSRFLAERGIAMLRFDFTGLGDSQGDFEETCFTTNINDVLAAAEFLRTQWEAPTLLVGHSLGGAAMLVAGRQVAEANAVVTIAAPGSTQQLARLLLAMNPQIESHGRGQVSMGGRSYWLRKEMIVDLRNHRLEASIASLQKPLLVIHSVVDETIGFEHAELIFSSAASPKSVVSLRGSDHLLTSQPEDIPYVGTLIAEWAFRNGAERIDSMSELPLD